MNFTLKAKNTEELVKLLNDNGITTSVSKTGLLKFVCDDSDLMVKILSLCQL